MIMSYVTLLIKHDDRKIMKCVFSPGKDRTSDWSWNPVCRLPAHNNLNLSRLSVIDEQEPPLGDGLFPVRGDIAHADDASFSFLD